MQRTTEQSTKQKWSQMTKDSQQISKVTSIIQEVVIMVEVDVIVMEAITTKVSTKIILEEDLDVGYAIKITISA